MSCARNSERLPTVCQGRQEEMFDRQVLPYKVVSWSRSEMACHKSLIGFIMRQMVRVDGETHCIYRKRWQHRAVPESSSERAIPESHGCEASPGALSKTLLTCSEKFWASVVSKIGGSYQAKSKLWHCRILEWCPKVFSAFRQYLVIAYSWEIRNQYLTFRKSF